MKSQSFSSIKTVPSSASCSPDAQICSQCSVLHSHISKRNSAVSIAKQINFSLNETVQNDPQGFNNRTQRNFNQLQFQEPRTNRRTSTTCPFHPRWISHVQADLRNIQVPAFRDSPRGTAHFHVLYACQHARKSPDAEQRCMEKNMQQTSQKNEKFQLTYRLHGEYLQILHRYTP